MDIKIAVMVLTIIALVYLFTSKRFKPKNRMVELSDLSKREIELANCAVERTKFVDTVSTINTGMNDLLEDSPGLQRWEKDYCKSILKNLCKVDDIRTVNSLSIFAHSINILRGDLGNIEKQFLGKKFGTNTTITQHTVYSCFDGDLDYLLIMYKSIINKSLVLENLQLQLANNS